MSEALWRSVRPLPTPTPTPTVTSPGIYLLCHNAWLQRFCRRIGCAASSVSVRWMRGFAAGPWRPRGATTVTSPFTGILVPFHSQTKGKVFKLDLKNRKYIYIYVYITVHMHAHTLIRSRMMHVHLTCTICAMTRTRVSMKKYDIFF